jgi:DNA-binding transcriptional ArsR family regulator
MDVLGQDDAATAPDPATLLEAPERVTELAFALSDPERTAMLAALARMEAPQTAEGLADSVGVDLDATRAHLKVLVRAGLVATRRTGLRRMRVYVPTVADLELRFFQGQRPAGDATLRGLARDARRRERQKKRLARKERRIAKEARRL